MPLTHKDPANIDMITRMIGAAGRHVAGLDPDALARLAELRDAVDLAVVVAIAGQRSQGVYWSSIAGALGVTKEAVIQRYGPMVRALQQANRLPAGQHG